MVKWMQVVLRIIVDHWSLLQRSRGWSRLLEHGSSGQRRAASAQCRARVYGADDEFGDKNWRLIRTGEPIETG